MARKIKKFGKVINTPEALAIYNEQQTHYAEVKQLEEQKKEHIRIYYGMEGKYALGTVADPYAGQGFRGYDYKYLSPEIKEKECAERQAYYAEHIAPLNEQINALNEKAQALEEALCVALWGFGLNHYRIKHNLELAEKELAEKMAYVEALRKELAELENRG